MFLRDALPPQTERSFEKQVIQLAELLGWYVWKDRATNARLTCAQCGEELRCENCHATVRNPRNPAGHPDLLLIRERVVWVEIKSERGRATSRQRAFLCLLRAAKAEVYLWKPSQWREIEKVLR